MPTAMHSHFICSFARSAFEIMSYMVAPLLLLLLLLVVSCACCVLLPLLASMAAIRASMSVYFRIPESLCLKMTSVPLNTNEPPCCTSSLVSGGLSSPPAHTQQQQAPQVSSWNMQRWLQELKQALESRIRHPLAWHKRASHLQAAAARHAFEEMYVLPACC